MTLDENRRPVSSRKVTLFHKLAQRLVAMGLHPNHVSMFSAVYAIIAGLAFWQASLQESDAFAIVYLVIAILGIQLRLVCNLIDGLMAVEGGLKTPTGEIYNDYPDRISDIAIFLGAGYAAASVSPWAIELGWCASLLAVMTAYTRVLGASMGATHFFSGPMAKQHRMFLITVVALVSIGERMTGTWGHAIVLGLALICLGSAVTCVRRLIQISDKITKATK